MIYIYRVLTNIFFPIFVLIIFVRRFYNKEHKTRYKEKIFISHFNIKRDNEKKIFWFHASSIGEVKSIMPLIKEINSKNRNINFLITTTTFSSGELIKNKISKDQNIIHRYFPLDTNKLVKSFLDQWRPDMAFFVDSEIWPNFLLNIKEKDIPLILINARITKKTLKKWKYFSSFSKKIFNTFDLCLAASKESQKNLKSLFAKNIKFLGNLKFIQNPEKRLLDKKNIRILNKFKVWCAASTHDGEDQLCIKAHIYLKTKHKKIITIIIPRHISRAKNIYNLCKNYNINSQILNNKSLISKNIEILIINSFDVLNKYFNYCDSIFIGKSMLKKFQLVGGQNPIEAAKFRCKIYHGPYVYNFSEIYKLLKQYKISHKVNNYNQLAKNLHRDFKKKNSLNQKINLKKLDMYGKTILQKTMKEINIYKR